MDKKCLKNYAKLLIDYSLCIKEGEKLFVDSTTLASPLIKEIYMYALGKGAIVECSLDFEDKYALFYEYASDEALRYVSLGRKEVFESFDAYLRIIAPFDHTEMKSVSSTKLKQRNEALLSINQIYNHRTASGELRRTLCEYPTQSSAVLANMSLNEYSDFIFRACKLDRVEPMVAWGELSLKQAEIVGFLDNVENLCYKNPRGEIKFSVKGRKWINSDGKVNMPSGEVFTSPVEDTVQGKMYFDYPFVLFGLEIKGVSLEVKDGVVVNWSAEKGKEALNKLFDIEGSRCFGEVAIGLNYGIQRPTKNILFDEKMGGTVHLAVGQSYLHTGGKNQSSIHVDFVADMKDGEIYADGQLIFENGYFLEF